MNRFLVSLTAAAALSALGATSSAKEAEMSEDAAAKLAEFERTGEFDNCLPLRTIQQITPLDERHFLVRVSVNNYYLNVTSSKCTGAHRTWTRIQYETTLSQLCSHEIIRIVDNSTGFTQGACSLGEFERLEEKTETAEEAPAEE